MPHLQNKQFALKFKFRRTWVQNIYFEGVMLHFVKILTLFNTRVNWMWVALVVVIFEFSWSLNCFNTSADTWLYLGRFYPPRFYQPRYNLGRFYLCRYYPSWFYPGSLSLKRILVITNILFKRVRILLKRF